MSRLILFVAGFASAVTMTAGLVSTNNGPEAHPSPSKEVLVGTDLGKIRRDALASHPVGSRVREVVVDLEKGGFRCLYRPPLMENITAPTVACNSNGRGGETSSRITLDLVSRSGALTDVVVSNGLDSIEASAITPDPDPGGIMPPPATVRVKPDPEWESILAAAKERYPRIRR